MEGSVKGKSKVAGRVLFAGEPHRAYEFHGTATQLRAALKGLPSGTKFQGTHLGTGAAVKGLNFIGKRHNRPLPAVISVMFD